MTDDDGRIRIWVNSNAKMSRGKYAAAAVHAALTAAGVHPGAPVIVLGGQRDHIEKMVTVIRDAGRTEVEPGTPTAGTDYVFQAVSKPAEKVQGAGDEITHCRSFLLPKEHADVDGADGTDKGEEATQLGHTYSPAASPLLSPDCREGKHPFHQDEAWDDEMDTQVLCACHCHSSL